MKKIRLLLLLLCVCIAACAKQEGTVTWEQVINSDMTETKVPESETQVSAKETDASGEQNGFVDTTETSAMIYVDVVGAVHRPGVVAVPYGARVYEAIAMAGGMREDAAAELVNQAAVLADGQQIRIYTQAEAQKMDMDALAKLQTGSAGETAKKGNAQGKININEAAAEELMELPGIGEAKAADIIRYREEHGGFQNIEEIMNISGIKEAVFDKIKDKIVVTQ